MPDAKVITLPIPSDAYARFWQRQAADAWRVTHGLRDQVDALDAVNRSLRCQLASAFETIEELQEEAGRQRDHRPAYLIGIGLWVLIGLLSLTVVYWP
jgi:Flp pilus assembly protein TadB